jgi:hypothetical protein
MFGDKVCCLGSTPRSCRPWLREGAARISGELRDQQGSCTGRGPSSLCTSTSPRTALLSCKTPHTCEGQLGVGASPIVVVPAPSLELLRRELSGCCSLLQHPRAAMTEGELLPSPWVLRLWREERK